MRQFSLVEAALCMQCRESKRDTGWERVATHTIPSAKAQTTNAYTYAHAHTHVVSGEAIKALRESRLLVGCHALLCVILGRHVCFLAANLRSTGATQPTCYIHHSNWSESRQETVHTCHHTWHKALCGAVRDLPGPACVQICKYVVMHVATIALTVATHRTAKSNNPYIHCYQ